MGVWEYGRSEYSHTPIPPYSIYIPVSMLADSCANLMKGWG